MRRIKRVNEIFLLTVAASVVASFLVASVSVALGTAGVVMDELVILLLSQFVFMLPTVFYLWENKFNLKEIIRLRPIKISTGFMLVGLMLLLIPAATMVNAISMKFTTNIIDTTITEIADKYPLAVGVLVVALVPAVLEESVYRGVFFNEYRKVNPRKAIVLSGFLFGLVHMNFNQFIYAFLLGMVFSIVVEVTDSIVSSMVMHFVMNGTSMVTIYAQKAMEGFGELETVDTAEIVDSYIRNGWPSAIGGVILAFFVLRLIAENEGRSQVLNGLLIKQTDEGNEAGTEKMATVALWLGMAICLGIMLLIEVTG